MVFPRIVARFDEVAGPEAGEAAFRYFEQPNEHTVAEYLRVCFHVMVAREHAVTLLIEPRWNLALANHWTRTEAPTLDLRESLARIDTPTLVVAGTDDPQYPHASIREVVDALRAPEVRWYEGARHAVFRDAPESMAEIREFIAS
jgi:pimeloyl-ACP methyl ester carboxylesterase